jgi:hypothetical protein
LLSAGHVSWLDYTEVNDQHDIPPIYVPRRIETSGKIGTESEWAPHKACAEYREINTTDP